MTRNKIDAKTKMLENRYFKHLANLNRIRRMLEAGSSSGDIIRMNFSLSEYESLLSDAIDGLLPQIKARGGSQFLPNKKD